MGNNHLGSNNDGDFNHQEWWYHGEPNGDIMGSGGHHGINSSIGWKNQGDGLKIFADASPVIVKYVSP
jgi:hypothetical protein